MSSKSLIQFVFCITLTFLSTTSFAQQKFSAGAMMLFGTGSTGNSTDVLTRAMMHTPIELFAGYNIKKFRIGLNYELDMVGQTADPAEFSNQNVGGSGNAMGLRFDYYDGKQSAGLIYNLSGSYTLSKATVSGASSVYDLSGMTLQYYRQIRNKIGFVIEYNTASMKSQAGNTDDLSSNRIGLGLIFTKFGK